MELKCSYSPGIDLLNTECEQNPSNRLESIRKILEIDFTRSHYVLTYISYKRKYEETHKTDAPYQHSTLIRFLLEASAHTRNQHAPKRNFPSLTSLNQCH